MNGLSQRILWAKRRWRIESSARTNGSITNAIIPVYLSFTSDILVGWKYSLNWDAIEMELIDNQLWQMQMGCGSRRRRTGRNWRRHLFSFGFVHRATWCFRIRWLALGFGMRPQEYQFATDDSNNRMGWR